MIDKIFDALSRDDLNIEEKLQGIETLVQYTIDNYTDDKGNVYLETIDAALNTRDIRTMSLMDIENVVEDCFLDAHDLLYDLLAITHFAKYSWGASSASVSHTEGLIMVKIEYGDKVFTKLIDVEE